MPDLQWLSGKRLTEIQKIQVQTPAGPQCFFFTKKKKTNTKQEKNLPYAKAKTNKKPPLLFGKNKPTNQQTNQQTKNKQKKQKINKKQSPHLLFFERSVL